MLPSRKIAFIVNPNARTGAVGRRWPFIQARARDRLGPFESYMSEGPGEAMGLTRLAIAGGAETLVCVGGDGTLNEVVNGLMDSSGPRGAEVLLAYLPNGTGCDFARSARIPKEIDEALDCIVDESHRLIDLGRLHYQNHEATGSCRYFHNVLSFGLGGEVDERVNRGKKAFGGFASFIFATLTSILRYDRKHIRLSVDDHFDDEVIAWNVAVANGRYHGGGMKVAPDADLSDGLFQVTVIGDLHVMEVFRHFPKLYNGSLCELEKVKTLAGRRVVASSCQRVLLDVDGEQLGRLPVQVEVVPSALRIICR